MLPLDLGVGAVFFFIGLMLALSKSVKGSAIVTCLLGIVGGGAGGVVFGGAHLTFAGQNGVSSQVDKGSLGWLLFALGIGGIAGLTSGTIWKIRAKKQGVDISVAVAQPNINAKDEIPPDGGA